MTPYTQIADNICQQVLSLQDVISSREKGAQFPTPQENSEQTKLINNLFRLNKQPTRSQALHTIAAFVEYVGERNYSLATVLYDSLKEYADDKKARPARPPMTAPLPAFAEHPSFTGAAQNDEEPQPAQPEAEIAPLEKQYAAGDAPPLTLEEFTNEKARLLHYEDGNKETTVSFNGSMVNKHWLDYNLLQYYLPIDKRRFIANEADYPKIINHVDTRIEIRKLLQTLANTTRAA